MGLSRNAQCLICPNVVTVIGICCLFIFYFALSLNVGVSVAFCRFCFLLKYIFAVLHFFVYFLLIKYSLHTFTVLLLLFNNLFYKIHMSYV